MGIHNPRTRILAILLLAVISATIYASQHLYYADGQEPYASQPPKRVLSLPYSRVPLDVPCWANPNSKRHPGTCTPTATTTAQPTSTVTPAPVQTETPTQEATATSTRIPTSTRTTTPTSTSVPPSATPSATLTPHWTNPPAHVLAEEAELEALINAHRISIGLNPLLHHDQLSRAQRWWAYDQIGGPGPEDDRCGHGDYGGRAFQMGYTGFAWGEAGACGFPNAPEAFQGWLDSPGHRGIVEAGNNMTEMGVGAWQYPNGNWQHYLLVGCGHTIPCGVGENRVRAVPLAPIIWQDD